MPITAYYKLVDWWLLVLFNLLALTLVFHTYLAYFISKADDGPQRGVTKDNIMKQAKYLNTLANLTFCALLVIFNFVFWTIATLEHFRPAEYYINGH